MRFVFMCLFDGSSVTVQSLWVRFFAQRIEKYVSKINLLRIAMTLALVRMQCWLPSKTLEE